MTDAFLAEQFPVDGQTVVRFAGKLDMQYAECAKDAGVAALAAAYGVDSAVVFDLRELTFCDSSGIAASMQIRRETEAQGRRLILRSPTRIVREVLRITGVDTCFTSNRRMRHD